MNLQWFSKNTVCINIKGNIKGKFAGFQCLIHLLFESGARGEYTCKWISKDFLKFEIVACNEELDVLCESWKRVVFVFSGEFLVSYIYVLKIKVGISWDTYKDIFSPSHSKIRSYPKKVCPHTSVCAQGVLCLTSSSTSLALGKEDEIGKQ